MAGRVNVTTGVAPSTHGFGRTHTSKMSSSCFLSFLLAPTSELLLRLLCAHIDLKQAPRMLSGPWKGSLHYNRPSERTTGGNSYTGGYKPEGNLYPERARAVRSAGYGQGKLAESNMNHYRPSAPFHTGTPANLQRPQFDNWSAKKKSSLGLFGTSSSVVYWGDLKERDEKMKAMRFKYDMNESRREIVREAFNKLDHDGDGLVTIDDLRSKGYNAKSHPRYIAEGMNHWTEDQIYLSVLARFKGGVYEPGTTVKYQDLRLEEFEEYYRIVGEDLDDEYFEAMMAQAWRIQRKNPGLQGYDNRILSQLALVEANMLQDKYLGQDELNRSKLEAVEIDSEQQAKIDSWRSMIQSGDFHKMNKAAEEIEVLSVCGLWRIHDNAIKGWVKAEEKMKDFSRPVPANAIRFFRSGGADMLTELACAQDAIIKRTCANILFWALKPELAQLELSKDTRGLVNVVTPISDPFTGKTRLIRDGLPAIAQGSDAVARNKAERSPRDMRVLSCLAPRDCPTICPPRMHQLGGDALSYFES
eukprot:700778-Hanusia_phi.AAC.1